MGFTAAYSQLYALDVEEGERLDRNPRITDWDGLQECMEQRGEMSTSTFKSLLVTSEKTDHSTYPRETWKVLKGFKSWKPADAFGLGHDPDRNALVKQIENHEDRERGLLGYGYNIERVGIEYGGVQGFWRTMFQNVSEHTEPFAVYNSPIAHRFPDVTDFRDGVESVDYIEAVNGQVYAEEQTFRRTNVDALAGDPSDRVADHEFTYPE